MRQIATEWPTPTLQPGERKLATYRGERSLGTRTVDGQLLLTDRRLIFSADPSDAAASRRAWECALSSIVAANTLARGSNPLSRLRRSRVRIDVDGTSEFFVVDNGPATVWAILGAAGLERPDEIEPEEQPDAAPARPRWRVTVAVGTVVVVALVVGAGAWWFLQRPLQPSQTITIGQDRVNGIAWSPNHDVIAVAAREIGVWDLDDGELAAATRRFSDVTDAAWSPDGNLLAFTLPFDHLDVFSAADGSQQLEREWRREPARGGFRESGYLALAWNPDGTAIAAVVRSPGQSTGSIEVLDAATGAVVAESAGSPEIHDVAWSPDGEQLATVEPHGTVRLYDADTLEPLPRWFESFASDHRFITDIAWHPDSRTIAMAMSNGAIRLWDSTWETPPTAFWAHDGDVTDIAWSPDGELLASSSRDDAVRLWRTDGTQAGRDRTGHGGDDTFVAWSPDGERLASASDGKILLWDALP